MKTIKSKIVNLEVQLGLKRYWLHDRTFLKLRGNFESSWKNANLLGYFQITNDSNADQPVYKLSFKYHAFIGFQNKIGCQNPEENVSLFSATLTLYRGRLERIIILTRILIILVF